MMTRAAGQHELGFKYGPDLLHEAVEGSRHPGDLYGGDAATGIAYLSVLVSAEKKFWRCGTACR
jgi:hypothetical protein